MPDAAVPSFSRRLSRYVGFAIACMLSVAMLLAALVCASPARAESGAVGSLTCDAWDQPREYTSVSELLSQASSLGGDSSVSSVTIDLYCDWNTHDFGRILVPSGKSYTINLHGHALDAHKAGTYGSPWYAEGEGEAIHLKDGATLTVNGGTGEEALTAHAGTLSDVYADADGNVTSAFWKLDGTGETVLYGGLITGGACDDHYGAGGISTEGAGCKVYLNDVTVAGNLTDQYGSSYGHGAGVAVHGKDSTLELSNAHVVYNHAEGMGGGVYVRNDGCTVILKNGSEVSHNLACYDGGGIYIDGNDVTLALAGSTISSNATHKNGGGLYHNGKRGSVSLKEGSAISSNQAKRGGGVYDYYDGTTYTLDASQISGNVADGDSSSGYGGGMYLNDEATVTLDNGSQLQGNYSSNAGGALFVMDQCSITLKNASSVCENSSGSGGGIFLEVSADVVLSDSTIRDNKAFTYDGGGMYIKGRKPSVSLLGKSSICGNVAQNSGGGIYISGANGNVDYPVVSSDGQGTITNNRCGASGGGVYSGANLTLTNLAITNNAAKCGGGIWSNYPSNVRDTTIQGNSATQQGGGVWLEKCDASHYGKLIVGGKIILDGNTLNGAASNLCYKLGGSDAPALRSEDPYYLAKGSHIGVTINAYETEKDGFATPNPLLKEIGDDYASCFFADDPTYSIVLDSSWYWGEWIYITKSNSTFALTVYGDSSQTPATSTRVAYDSTVTLNSADYLSDGCVPAYWEVVEGLGAVTRLVPVDGAASFTMPANAVTVRAVYLPILQGVSLGLSDATATWEAVGTDAGLVSVTGLTLTDNRGETYELGADAASSVARVVGCRLESSTVASISKQVVYDVELDASLFEDYGLYVPSGSDISGSARASLMATVDSDCDVACSSEAADGGLSLAVTARFARDDARMRVATLNFYDINEPDPMAVATERSQYGTQATVSAPAIAGWQFVSWSALPEGATEDAQTHVVTLAADTADVELSATYKPLLTRLDLKIADPRDVLNEFPAQVESYTPYEGSGADLVALCGTWQTSVEWSRADGKDLAEPQPLPGVTYAADVKVHVSATLDHTFGLTQGVYVTVNGTRADAVQVEGEPGAWVLSVRYLVTTDPDASLDKVLTDLSDVALVDASELTSWLPAQVVYLTRDARTLRADVTWDLSPVDVSKLEQGVTVKGTFTDASGGVQEVSRTFTLAELGLPQASVAAGRIEAGTQVELSAGQGWEGFTDAQLYYYVLPTDSQLAPDQVDYSDFAPYASAVQIDESCTLLAYAQVGLRQTGLAQWAYQVVAVSSVSVGSGTALDEDGREVERVFEGDLVHLVADDPAEGQDFAGWEVVSGEAQLADPSSFETTFAMPAGDVVVRATYTAHEYTVSFDAAGGSPAPEAQSVAWGACAQEPDAPALAGWAFLGWYAAGSEQAWDFGTPVTGSLALTARWEPACTVAFDPANGEGAFAQKVVTGEFALEPAEPARPGYEFLGWFTAEGTLYRFNEAVEGDLALTAGWDQLPPTSFADVPEGTWFHDWVAQASSLRLMTGYKDGDAYTGLFGPEDALTRGQVATVLWRLAGCPQAADGGSFPDVGAGQYYSQAVSWCAATGVVTGYEAGPNAGLFLPGADVTREELAVMLWRFERWAGVDVAEPPAGAFEALEDGATVSAWAREACVWCAAAGIMTGKETAEGTLRLDPGQGATRAQAAKMLVRAYRILWREVDPYAGTAAGQGDGEAEVQADQQADGEAASAQVFEAVVTFDDVTPEAEVASTDATPEAEAASADEQIEAAGDPDDAAEGAQDAPENDDTLAA